MEQLWQYLQKMIETVQIQWERLLLESKIYPGSGKSAALRILAERLGAVRDLGVGLLTRPQANMADFYRELGPLFGVPLSPHNRWKSARGRRCDRVPARRTRGLRDSGARRSARLPRGVY